jgi:sec-independent protein translocase protein TatC
MTLLAIPLCLLYFLSGLFALLVDKRRYRRNDAESRLTAIDKPEEI